MRPLGCLTTAESIENAIGSVAPARKISQPGGVFEGGERGETERRRWAICRRGVVSNVQGIKRD
jgi:hypothetical protein